MKRFMLIGFVTLFLAIPQYAAAHCDTLDGPVVQDAKKAIKAKDITPVLKWVKQGDEKRIRTAFDKVTPYPRFKVEGMEIGVS